MVLSIMSCLNIGNIIRDKNYVLFHKIKDSSCFRTVSVINEWIWHLFRLNRTDNQYNNLINLTINRQHNLLAITLHEYLEMLWINFIWIKINRIKIVIQFIAAIYPPMFFLNNITWICIKVKWIGFSRANSA